MLWLGQPWGWGVTVWAWQDWEGYRWPRTTNQNTSTYMYLHIFIRIIVKQVPFRFCIWLFWIPNQNSSPTESSNVLQWVWSSVSTIGEVGGVRAKSCVCWPPRSFISFNCSFGPASSIFKPQDLSVSLLLCHFCFAASHIACSAAFSSFCAAFVTLLASISASVSIKPSLVTTSSAKKN